MTQVAIVICVTPQLTVASLSGRLAIHNCEGAAEVDITDLYSDNGIVHSVDTVL